MRCSRLRSECGTRRRKAAIIDPGGEVERLLAILKDQRLELEKIWVTHGHLDHAGGAAALKAATGVPIHQPGDLEHAVEAVRVAARAGEIVLLSPACASYDQFADFEDRGERFRELVAALAPADSQA